MTHETPGQTASIERLQWRAQLMADVRYFFATRGVMEVDTPILSQAAPTAPYLDSFETLFQYGSFKQTRYLHTSPEFAMKRLLSEGSGPIYQIAHVFRNGEAGHQHSPEFSMLEWYRPGFDLSQLMDEVDALMQQIAATAPSRRVCYAELFRQILQLDIFNCDDAALRQTALTQIPSLPTDWQAERDDWLALLMSEVIEPILASWQQPVLVYDFPASQAQLAKLYRNEAGQWVAARFELYAGGMELANGYDELCDAQALQQRFEQDNQHRQRQGKPEMPIDQNLLQALHNGLPPCSGVALGLDRLLMLKHAVQNIAQIQSMVFADS